MAAEFTTTREGREHRGFTLTELLVVIAVIGILVGLLLPAVLQTQGQALTASCKMKTRDIGQGLAIYRMNYGVYPPYLTYLLSDKYSLDPEAFQCPSDASLGAEGCKPNFHADQYIHCDWDGGTVTSGSDTIPCSYLYENNMFQCEWAPSDPAYVAHADTNVDGVVSWAEAKRVDRDGWPAAGWPAYGAKVPIVRCFWHLEPGQESQQVIGVINVTYETHTLYVGKPDWKDDL